MLTRVNVSRFAAAALVVALALVPAVSAHAVTTGDRVASTARAIDATAQRWFDAQSEAARLDAEISDIRRRIDTAQVAVAQVRKLATARAVVMYKSADVGVSTIFGDSALDAARRVHLVDDANAGGDAVIAELESSISELDAQRAHLEQDRARQQKVLAAVAAERRALDAELQSVRADARRQAAASLARARDRASRLRAQAYVRSLVAARTSDALAAPTGAPLGPGRFAPPPPNGGRVSPHHDEPFLVCTRARESGGRYDAVSPSGYYGAYQFLPSTWDSTAMHASRSDLVGVLPSRASAYDQDELAWALYQWQGNAPWGGRC